MTERIQSNVEQGVRAASSAQSFIKESGAQSSQNVTINMGGQTVNQNIDAQIPLDAPHIKEATTSGMKDGVSEVAQTLLSVMQSKNIF